MDSQPSLTLMKLLEVTASHRRTRVACLGWGVEMVAEPDRLQRHVRSVHGAAPARKTASRRKREL